MIKRVFVLTLAAATIAAAAGFVRASVGASFVLPQMEMPYADTWARLIDFGEKEDKHAGELGDIAPGWGYAFGYGVSLGEYFRFDAAGANVRTEHKVTYTYTEPETNIGYTRDVNLTTHIVPIFLTGSFVAPGLFGDRLKPEFGLGVAAFIADYNTYQKTTITVPGEDPVITEGFAWARDVAYGPVTRAGVSFALMDNLAVEGAGTYYAGEASFPSWTRHGDTPLNGPAREDFTGWAIYVGPRYYF